MSDRETTPASLSLMWNNSLANVVCPQQLEEDLTPPAPPTDLSDKAQKKNCLQFWKGSLLLTARKVPYFGTSR